MRKNPVIPFALIAVLGIVIMIIVSAAGINQREAIQNEEEGGEHQEETVDASPEEMFQNKCSNCHGGDLGGGSGPNLQEVGSRYSPEEIEDIIVNGKGSAMPAGLYTGEQATQLAEWLAEQQ